MTPENDALREVLVRHPWRYDSHGNATCGCGWLALSHRDGVPDAEDLIIEEWAAHVAEEWERRTSLRPEGER